MILQKSDSIEPVSLELNKSEKLIIRAQKDTIIDQQDFQEYDNENQRDCPHIIPKYYLCFQQLKNKEQQLIKQHQNVETTTTRQASLLKPLQNQNSSLINYSAPNDINDIKNNNSQYIHHTFQAGSEQKLRTIEDIPQQNNKQGDNDIEINVNYKNLNKIEENEIEQQDFPQRIKKQKNFTLQLRDTYDVDNQFQKDNLNNYIIQDSQLQEGQIAKIRNSDLIMNKKNYLQFKNNINNSNQNKKKYQQQNSNYNNSKRGSTKNKQLFNHCNSQNDDSLANINQKSPELKCQWSTLKTCNSVIQRSITLGGDMQFLQKQKFKNQFTKSQSFVNDNEQRDYKKNWVLWQCMNVQIDIHRAEHLLLKMDQFQENKEFLLEKLLHKIYSSEDTYNFQKRGEQIRQRNKSSLFIVVMHNIRNKQKSNVSNVSYQSAEKQMQTESLNIYGGSLYHQNVSLFQQSTLHHSSRASSHSFQKKSKNGSNNNKSQDLVDKQSSFNQQAQRNKSKSHALTRNSNTHLNQKNNIKTVQIQEEPQLVCKICFLPRFISEFKNTSSKCDHSFCLFCLQNFIINKVFNNQVLNIKCPDIKCGIKLKEQDIQNILPTKWLLKYKEIKLSQEISHDPLARWCVAKGCSGYYKINSKSEKQQCITCYNNHCSTCFQQYHPGFECHEIVDIEYINAVEQQKIKKCPQCDTTIQKYQGVNKMQCWNCNYQFCWICFKQYKINHYKKWNLCMGCPGMAYYQPVKNKLKSQKIVYQIKSFFYIWLLIFYFLIIICFLPLIWVIIAFSCPTLMIKQQYPQVVSTSKRSKTFYVSMVFITIIFYPIFLILSIIPGTCYLLQFWNDINKNDEL